MSEMTQYKVYEIDVGVLYWVAASSIREALRLFDDVGYLQDNDTNLSLSIYECKESRARRIILGRGSDGISAWARAYRKDPAVLSCWE